MMLRQTGRLLRWSLLRNPLRTLFLILTIVGSMSAFSTTEATLRDLANRAGDVWRLIPYDFEVTGETVFDLEKQIAAIPGVGLTERALHCAVSVNAITGKATVQMGNGRLRPARFSEGYAPELPDEIAITSMVAESGKIALGDVVDVAWLATMSDTAPGDVILAEAKEFRVCGIVNWVFGDTCLLSEAGLQRIHSNPAKAAMLLVKMDGAVEPAAIGSSIRQLSRKLRVSEMNDNDNVILDVASSLSQTISLIMLLAGVGSFYMLLSLSQRERFYDLGVLRAVGVSSARLAGQLILEGLLLLVLGAVLGSLLIFSVTSVLHLANVSTTLAQNLQPMMLLFALFLAVIVYSATRLAGQPATVMLRGER